MSIQKIPLRWDSYLFNLFHISYEQQKLGSKACSKNAHSESNQHPPIFCLAMDPVVDIQGSI